MRIVVLIIGLIFGFWVMAEGLLVSALYDLGNAEEEQQMAALGFMAGFIALFAAAFAMAFPMVSVVLFCIASLFSLGAAASGYPNHWVYLFIFLFLMAGSFLGWRGKRKEKRERDAERQRQIERDNRLEQLLQEKRGAP